MARVEDQDQEHPLLEMLGRLIDSRVTDGDGWCRLWKPGQKRRDTSQKLAICWAILRHSVRRWKALSQQERDWWEDNHPAWTYSGYHWFLFYDMVQDYGGGPWKVGVSEAWGKAYIVPEAAKEGVKSLVYCGATRIGSTSVLIKTWSA